MSGFSSKKFHIEYGIISATNEFKPFVSTFDAHHSVECTNPNMFMIAHSRHRPASFYQVPQLHVGKEEITIRMVCIVKITAL